MKFKEMLQKKYFRKVNEGTSDTNAFKIYLKIEKDNFEVGHTVIPTVCNEIGLGNNLLQNIAFRWKVFTDFNKWYDHKYKKELNQEMTADGKRNAISAIKRYAGKFNSDPNFRDVILTSETDSIAKEEGFRAVSYLDSNKTHTRPNGEKGYLTIGYGFNLDESTAKATAKKHDLNYKNLCDSRYNKKFAISKHQAKLLMSGIIAQSYEEVKQAIGKKILGSVAHRG